MNNKHTTAEKTQIRKGLISLRSYIFALNKENRDLREIQNFLDGLIQNSEAELHDVFGLNKIITAIESIQMAVNEIGFGGDVMLAFLFHAVIEKESQVAQVRKEFGDKVADYLSSFIRVSQLDTKVATLNTDNFRNLFIQASGDMRVVLLLIVKCVVMMRKIKDTPMVAQQRMISEEAAYLYAPLAHKLGLYTMKSELEDLSLKYLEHDAYYLIKDKLNETKKSRDAYIERFIAPIRDLLDAEGYKYKMKGRTKSIHSIWQKMKKQNCGFEKVYDLFAIRIILDAPLSKEQEQCWKVFSLITDKYESNLKRLRDWLTVPKSNGYESLHITVLGPEEKWVEVQIRTERMDDIAEHGLAAHWRYKGVRQDSDGIDSWLANIRNSLEQGDEKGLANSLSTSVSSKNIYVFSPKGDIYKLPEGSTVLDFAYHIHTGVGNHCIGGKIDNKNVSLRHAIHSGDTVEILTSNAQTPKAEWLNICVSPHAKSKIRSAVKEISSHQSALVREQLERRLKNRKLDWDENVINVLIHKFNFKEASEFFRYISEGKLDVSTVLEKYIEIATADTRNSEQVVPTRSAEDYVLDFDTKNNQAYSNDVLIIDRNLKGIDFQMARCCNPVYGDDVFGFVTSGNGIKIHRKNCPNAPAMRERFAYRIVDAKWAGKGGDKYPISLRVIGNDDIGIVNNITGIITKEEKIMLRSISIDSNDGLFSGILTIMVENTDILSKLIKKLRTVKGVKAVSRT